MAENQEDKVDIPEKESKKVKFYDWTFKIMIFSFLAFIFFWIIFIQESFDASVIFFFLGLFSFFLSICCKIVFDIGMLYNSFKIKRYGWFIVLFFLGILLSWIFYFSIMRDEFIKSDLRK